MKGDRERAAQQLEKALSIWESSLGPDHPKVAVSLNNMASLYRKRGEFRASRATLREGARDLGKELGSRFTTNSPTHCAVSLRSASAMAIYERAKSFLKRVLALEEKTRGAVHIDTAVALGDLASALLRHSRDHARAEPLLKRALAILEDARGPDHPRCRLRVETIWPRSTSRWAIPRAQSVSTSERSRFGQKSWDRKLPPSAASLERLGSVLSRAGRIPRVHDRSTNARSQSA